MTASSDTNRPGTPGDARTPDAGKANSPAPSPSQTAAAARPDSAKVEPIKVGSPGIEPGKPDLDRTNLTKADPAKLDPAKPDPAKSDATKPDPTKSDAIKPSAPAVDAVRAETAGSGAPKPDAFKPAPSKPDAPKADVLKADTPKADAPKGSGFAGGAQVPPRTNQAVTDGPIIDLKAKRLPDPAPSAKPAATGAGVTPGVSVKPEPKSADAKSADAKAADIRASDTGNSDSKTTGTKPAEPKSADARGPGGMEPGKPAGTTPRIAPAAIPPAAARGAGFGSLATAGLLGGIVGAGLLFGVQRAGIIPAQDDSRLAALDQRIAALAPREALVGLDKRVAANEAALKAVPEAVATAKEALQKAGNAPAAPADAAASQAAPTASVPADLVARLDSLDQRVSALQEEPGQQGGEAKMAATPSGAGTVQVAALDERLKALEGRIESGPKAAQPDLAPKLAALQSDVDSRTKANAEAAEAVGQKLAALQQSLDARVKAATEAVQAATAATQQAVDANRTQAGEAAKAVERQLQAQSDKIAGLDKAVAERAETGTVQAALRVVSADRIVTALGTGAPYADALASLRGLDPGDPARLTAVAVFADKGAPTARGLAAEFRPIADRISSARRAAQTRSVAESGDFGRKIMSMAESIVQVRKVDAPAATGATAAADPVPAVQDALDRGDIPAAAQAFAALPEDIRGQAGDFGTKLKSRAAATAAAEGLLADAFKAIPAAGTSR